MRNLQLEASIWSLFTSIPFFEATAQECDGICEWFCQIAGSRGVADFGRNEQISETLKRRAGDFRRGAEQASRGDYELIWTVSDCISGDLRGMMDQPLHSWMTEVEYMELGHCRTSRLLAYTSSITHALNNAMYGAPCFFDLDEDEEGEDDAIRANDDDGFPGGEIVEVYRDNTSWYKDALFWKLPDPLPEFEIDTSISCTTGDEVPWTGVWYPSTGLEKHSLTFAVKGHRMQKAYRVIRTTEELRTEEQMFPPPETVAVSTVWHPVIPTNR